MTPHADPLVSAVVPALRNDAYVQQAVGSLLADGYPNLEIVVVWDGEPGLLEPTWDTEPRIRQVANGTRMGATHALNRGVAECRGELIARLDADDVSYAGRLRAQVDVLRADPAASVVATGARVIGPDGELLGDYPRPGADVRRELLRRNPIVHSSLLVRRSALDEVGGYDVRCTRMQDYHLLLRLACRGGISVLEQRYVGYRVHAQQSGAQAADFWRGMRMITGARRDLARHLGANVAAQRARDAHWIAAQWARYHRLRPSRLAAARTRSSQVPAGNA